MRNSDVSPTFHNFTGRMSLTTPRQPVYIFHDFTKYMGELRYARGVKVFSLKTMLTSTMKRKLKFIYIFRIFGTC